MSQTNFQVVLKVPISGCKHQTLVAMTDYTYIQNFSSLGLLVFSINFGETTIVFLIYRSYEIQESNF